MIYEMKSPIIGLEQIAKVELEQIDERFVKIRGLRSDGSDCGLELRLVNPYALKRDYSLDVPTSIQTLLHMHSGSNVRVFCVMILQNPIQNSCVNFLAPIVFNDDNHSAAQIILHAQEYPKFSVAEPISNYIYEAIGA
ncbi:flagellar biosynthesis protein FliW [Helicobacter monodelphidis]|uniref:flagellar assembly protein FliW n=1 Tax=Helicobacter sp. 15-1451 TaxID=2004995 RepID=UPI000DCC277D|nr:flagellar assembly protein FliW [Helicobacter sp. 15-1451]RAX59312.1 flagellar biosynthesis protein FliW [Helicobacter sp. 15-1451]